MSSVSSMLGQRAAEALLGGSSDAILVTNRDGIIQVWNPGAERIFGYAEKNALGRSLDLIIPERLRVRHWQGWTKAVETGSSRYSAGALLAVPAMTADGRRISVEFTILLLHDASGHIDGVAAFLRDVTARFEEMRELKRRLALLST